MKQIKLSLLSFLVVSGVGLGLTGCGSNSSGNSGNSISGFVDDEPVAGANVFFALSDGTYIGSATTDKNGAYTIDIPSDLLSSVTSSNDINVFTEKDGKMLRGKVLNYTGGSYSGDDTYVSHNSESALQIANALDIDETEFYKDFLKIYKGGDIEADLEDSNFNLVASLANDIRTKYYDTNSLSTYMSLSDIFGKIDTLSAQPEYSDYINSIQSKTSALVGNWQGTYTALNSELSQYVKSMSDKANITFNADNTFLGSYASTFRFCSDSKCSNFVTQDYPFKGNYNLNSDNTIEFSSISYKNQKYAIDDNWQLAKTGTADWNSASNILGALKLENGKIVSYSDGDITLDSGLSTGVKFTFDDDVAKEEIVSLKGTLLDIKNLKEKKDNSNRENDLKVVQNFFNSLTVNKSLRGGVSDYSVPTGLFSNNSLTLEDINNLLIDEDVTSAVSSATAITEFINLVVEFNQKNGANDTDKTIYLLKFAQLFADKLPSQFGVIISAQLNAGVKTLELIKGIDDILKEQPYNIANSIYKFELKEYDEKHWWTHLTGFGVKKSIDENLIESVKIHYLFGSSTTDYSDSSEYDSSLSLSYKDGAFTNTQTTIFDNLVALGADNIHPTGVLEVIMKSGEHKKAIINMKEEKQTLLFN